MSSADPKYELDLDSLLSVVRGFRNGVVYGAKIRFTHALVMTLLFKQGSFYDKALSIWRATYQHATNLGLFAAVFKLIRVLLRWLRQKDDGFNTFLAGLAGGFVRFSSNDPLTSQINMYILSRVIFGAIRAGIEGQLLPYHPYVYPAFGSIIWGLVMLLFFHYPGNLQRSMEVSMDFIYAKSDTVPPLPETYAGILDWMYQGDKAP